MIASYRRKAGIFSVVFATILGCSIVAYCTARALHPQPTHETAHRNPNLYAGWSAEDSPDVK